MNRDGTWNETGLLHSFPADGLKIRWHKPVGRRLSSPAVADGRVFLTDAQFMQPAAKERIHQPRASAGSDNAVWRQKLRVGSACLREPLHLRTE